MGRWKTPDQLPPGLRLPNYKITQLRNRFPGGARVTHSLIQEGALMNVEYTGRHYEVTNAIRQEVETGLTKIRKILGDKFDTKVILTVEKHRHKAEITISPRNGPLVGLAQARDMSIAVNEALDHLEKQAIKYKTRWQAKKRSARKSEEVKKWNGGHTAPEEQVQTTVGLTEKTAVPVLVH